MFRSHARSICQPFAPRSLPASSLIWLAPTSMASSRTSRALTLGRPILRPLRTPWISWVPSHISTNSPTPETPVDWPGSGSPGAPRHACCLPSGPRCQLSTITDFGAITFTFRFQLECFAVYASPPLLPPGTQDSLHSGAGSSFCGRTCTCKMCAAFPSAQPKPPKICTSNRGGVYQGLVDGWEVESSGHRRA